MKDPCFKPLEKRNKWICENRGKSLKECLNDYHGVFTWHDHFLISIFEMLELNKYISSPKKDITNDLDYGDDINLEVFGSVFNFSYIDFIKPSEIKDHYPNNKAWNSFFKLAEPEDMIIKYAYHHQPQMGIGYLILIRKINGRYEAMEKFRWYVS